MRFRYQLMRFRKTAEWTRWKWWSSC